MTILLVEDEDEVRELVGRMLEVEGYTVIVAADALEALEISERHAGPIHLLLTDIVMPEMSGLELCDRLARSRPETRVLLMSGYTDEPLPSGVLQKPFPFSELARRVREVLEAR